MVKINWEKYIHKTADRPPRDLLVKSLQFVHERELAMDIGAGALMDTKHLLNEGFKTVIAIDADPTFLIYAENISDPRFQYANISLLDFPYSRESCDLINAQRVLPYLNKDDFKTALVKISNSVKAGGVFTGMFFGNNDQQILPDGVEITRVTAADLKQAFLGFEILELEETENDTQSTMGTFKHFHEIGIIAKKVQ